MKHSVDFINLLESPPIDDLGPTDLRVWTVNLAQANDAAESHEHLRS